MALYKTTAVVLRSIPYREADVLLTLYTLARGRVSALARGVRKSKSRLRGGVQPLTQGSFELHAGKGLDTVTQSQLEAAFPRLHLDIERWAHASCLAELIMALMVEKEKNPELFALLLSSLHLMEEKTPLLVSSYFKARFLALLGYRPQLTSCGTCGKALNSNWLRVSQEGLLCDACAALQSSTRPIGGRTLAALRCLFQARPAVVGHLVLSGEVLGELTLILDFWLNQYLDRPLKSAAFLLALSKEG